MLHNDRNACQVETPKLIGPIRKLRTIRSIVKTEPDLLNVIKAHSIKFTQTYM